MLDVLLPATDAGVAAQFIVLAVVAGFGAWFTRHNRDLLRLVLGLSLLLASLMTIRAIH